MAKRNPKDPIPGFEQEGYTGTVGRETKTHKTHFSMPEKTWTSGNDYAWKQVRPSVWRWVPEKERTSDEKA